MFRVCEQCLLYSSCISLIYMQRYHFTISSLKINAFTISIQKILLFSLYMQLTIHILLQKTYHRQPQTPSLFFVSIWILNFDSHFTVWATPYSFSFSILLASFLLNRSNDLLIPYLVKALTSNISTSSYWLLSVVSLYLTLDFLSLSSQSLLIFSKACSSQLASISSRRSDLFAKKISIRLSSIKVSLTSFTQYARLSIESKSTTEKTQIIASALAQKHFVIDLNLYCPAVSQKHSIIFLSSIFFLILTKSQPTVEGSCLQNSSFLKALTRLVFPVALLPNTTIFISYSGQFCILLTKIYQTQTISFKMKMEKHPYFQKYCLIDQKCDRQVIAHYLLVNLECNISAIKTNSKCIIQMNQSDLCFEGSSAELNSDKMVYSSGDRALNEEALKNNKFSGRLQIQDVEEDEDVPYEKIRMHRRRNKSKLNQSNENISEQLNTLAKISSTNKQDYKLKVINLDEDDDDQIIYDEVKKQKGCESAYKPKNSERQSSIKSKITTMRSRKKSNDNYQDCSLQGSEESSEDSGDHHKMKEEEEQSAMTTETMHQSIENSVFMRSNRFLQKYSTYIIRRNQQWLKLNRLRPVFHCHAHKSQEHLFSAKLVSSNITTTFIVSQSETDFIENDENYLAKIKTNFLANEANIFGPGFSPSYAKKHDCPLRNMLATVIFETRFFQEAKPRQFTAYVLKEGVQYYNLLGTSKFEEEKPLNILYQQEANLELIHVFTNKKPQYDPSSKTYILDFGGRVSKASMKNFILEDVSQNDQTLDLEREPEQIVQEHELPIMRMLFGKVAEDVFVMDIGQPLSPLIGFCLGLSSFGNKIGCE